MESQKSIFNYSNSQTFGLTLNLLLIAGARLSFGLPKTLLCEAASPTVGIELFPLVTIRKTIR